MELLIFDYDRTLAKPIESLTPAIASELVRLLENNYSSQTNNLGIMQPTLDSIIQTYQVDLVRLFREG